MNYSKKNKIVVVQVGARMHYAVPIIFEKLGVLNLFITDFYYKSNLGVLDFFPDVYNWKRLFTRVNMNLPKSKIYSINLMGIIYRLKMIMAVKGMNKYNNFLWAAKSINRIALRRLKLDSNKFDSLYLFNSSGLELMEYYGGKKKLILEQCIAIHKIEVELLEIERKNFPEWEYWESNSQAMLEFIEREKEELALADIIICPSEFVEKSVISLNPSYKSKTRVVPYGVALSLKKCSPKIYLGNRPLKILTVGAVGLRKGSPYILEAAKHFVGKVEFTIVGDYSQLSKDIVSELKAYINLVGHVSRDKVSEFYKCADVFLLPSICEGSATVTYEAMQYGLPLIVTPNTGSVVRNGEEGIIIEAGNSQCLVDAINILLNSPYLVSKYSSKVINRASYASLDSYSKRLSEVLIEE